MKNPLGDIAIVVVIVLIMSAAIIGSVYTLANYEFGSPSPELAPQVEVSSWIELGAPGKVIYTTIEVDGNKFVVFTKPGYSKEGIVVVPLYTPVEKE